MTGELLADDLKQLESVIERGQKTFIEVGQALVRIRDERLYRETHKNWPAYLAERWPSIQKRMADRLIGAAEVVGHIASVTDVLPKNEGSIRALANLPIEEMKDIYLRAVAIAGGKAPTQKQIDQARDDDSPQQMVVSNPQGLAANWNGRSAEELIISLLIRHGVEFYRQYPVGTGIFYSPIFADIYLPSISAYPAGLIIESKWQQVSGTTQEKLCYLVENIEKVYPRSTIVVIDGDGFSPGALRWLREQVGRGPLVAVYSLTEMLTWCNRNLEALRR